MRKYNFNSSKYSIVIENGDIQLQGMHEDIFFFGAWDEIYRDLEREFWSSDFCQVRSLNDFVEYEQDGRIICYLNDHQKEGKVIAHCVN